MTDRMEIDSTKCIVIPVAGTIRRSRRATPPPPDVDEMHALLTVDPRIDPQLDLAEEIFAEWQQRQFTLTLSGNASGGRSGEAVASPPTVRVTYYDDGKPIGVPGVRVRFVVTRGRGRVYGARRDTNADGAATVGAWVLGDVGFNELTAVVSGAEPLAIRVSAAAPSVEREYGDADGVGPRASERPPQSQTAATAMSSPSSKPAKK